MNLEDLKIYNLSMELGEKVWTIVDGWTYFQRDTVGKQFVRAADSIAANFSEGYGRYHYKEAKNFSYYSRGSLFETKTWLQKSHNRRLISDDDFKLLSSSLELIGKMLNNYIKTIGTVNEPPLVYGDHSIPND
jgi:four helix bundle protein